MWQTWLGHQVPLPLAPSHAWASALSMATGPAPLTAVVCSSLKVESFRATMAQRLVRMLQICAGHVPGVSALNLMSLLRSPESPPSKEL